MVSQITEFENSIVHSEIDKVENFRVNNSSNFSVNNSSNFNTQIEVNRIKNTRKKLSQGYLITIGHYHMMLNI